MKGTTPERYKKKKTEFKKDPPKNQKKREVDLVTPIFDPTNKKQ
jgi:hypothetical protein